MSEMKDTLDGIIKLDIAEEKINELDDIIIVTTPNETHTEKKD